MAYTYYKIASFSGGWHSGRIGIEVVSQSIEGNYSDVNIGFSVRKDVTSSSYNLGGANMFISRDGTSLLSSNSIDFRTYVIGTWYNQLQALSHRVYHNADGTASINVRGYCATGVGAGTYDQTQTLTLPTIPRKSSIASLTSSVDVNGTNQVSVGISRASTSFTHTVGFYFGSYSQEYTGVATSQAYAIPTAWLNAIPNAASGSALCRVTTWSGATNLGYVDGYFTLTVPSTVIPVVSDIAFAKDTTGTDPFPAGTYVVGISKVKATGITVTNQYSATTSLLKTYIHDDGQSYLSAIAESMVFDGVSFTSNAIKYSGVNNLTVLETDSRGRVSAAYVETITAYSYAVPSLTVTGERCDSAGAIDPNGEYLKFRFQAGIDPVNNTNSKTYTMEYKRTIDGSWTSISTASLTGYTADYSVVRAASSSYSWEVRGTVQDLVNTISKTAEVETASVVIDFLSGGGGMAIGKVAELSNKMECELPAQFNNGLIVDLRKVYYSGVAYGEDCNTYTQEWRMGGGSPCYNFPTTVGMYYFINTVFYSSTDNARQIAYGYDGAYKDYVWTRSKSSGVWGSWAEVRTKGAFAQLQFGTVQQALTTGWVKFTRFTNYISQGLDFSGNTTDQSITCNFTGYAEVTIKLYYNGATVGDSLYLGLANGANIKAFAILKASTTADSYMIIAPVILPVTSGDILTVQVMNLTASRGSCGSSGSAVAADHITVKRI